MRLMRGERGKDAYVSNPIVQKDWPWTYPEYALMIDVNFAQIESIESYVFQDRHSITIIVNPA